MYRLIIKVPERCQQKAFVINHDEDELVDSVKLVGQM